MNRDSAITLVIIVLAVIVAFNLSTITSITGMGVKSGRIIEPTEPMITVKVSPSQLFVEEALGVDKKGEAEANLNIEVTSKSNNVQGFKEEVIIARVSPVGGKFVRYTTDIDCSKRDVGVKAYTNCKELAKKGGTGVARQFVKLPEGNYVVRVYDNSVQRYVEAPFTVLPLK
jgi:hypothetical protein